MNYADNHSSSLIALAHYKSIVDSSSDAIISKTPTGVVLSWNSGAERLFGYDAEEAVGHQFHFLIPADRLQEEIEILSRVGKGETIDQFQTLRRHKSGRLIPVSATISPILNDKYEVIGISKIVRDNSTRAAMEAELLTFATWIDSTGDAVIGQTVDGIITSWNLGAERLFGFSAGSIIGKPIYLLVPHDRLPEELEFLEKLSRGISIQNQETKRRHRDGHLIEVSVSIFPIRSSSGKVLGASKVVRAIP
jgi:PAS domain S-box-containing protein